MVLLLVLLNLVCISFTLWSVAAFSRESSRRLKSLDDNFQLFIKFYLTGGKD